MSVDIIKELKNGLMVLVLIQLGVVFFPHATLIYIPKRIYEYFKPDFETALVNEYIRPIIGLRLCQKCSILRYCPKRYRIRHFDNPIQLEASGSKGCWLCHSVHLAFLQSQADRETPPALDFPEQLPSQALLLWFAERTETGSGFLDHLRGKSMATSQQL